MRAEMFTPRSAGTDFVRRVLGSLRGRRSMLRTPNRRAGLAAAEFQGGSGRNDGGQAEVRRRSAANGPSGRL